MIRYKSFKVSAEAAINKFLEQHQNGINLNAINYSSGRINFIYSDETDLQKIEKDQLIAVIKRFINERKSEVLGKDLDERYWRGMALKNQPKAQDNAVKFANEKNNLLAQIHYAKQILEEVERDEYLF